ncbi:unnamed protein product [Dibothriocephalus latus]|uniref:GAR domain-containing protein n=1 Tax=Dibothriocephalus latus TaxID=60516 RepID=A0A3P6TXN8_DIBLA|nr:unnamed protein product [Dibothriocephalus latus]
MHILNKRVKISPSVPTSTPEAQAMGTQDEFSAAIAEDLAQWASHLFPDLAGDLKGDNFFDKISGGILLCHILFETEDLVSRKNLRSVIVCLLEVAKFGIDVLEIVHLEKQIDAELAAERRGVSKREEEAKPSSLKITVGLWTCLLWTKSYLNDLIRMGSLTKPMAFEIRPERYLRLLRGHIMVRVDGGWDTLNHFLQEHDEGRKVYDANTKNADWTEGPLQREPPKDFKPQALDPEPVDLKPTPYAYVAELDKNRAILPGEDTYDVRIHCYSKMDDTQPKCPSRNARSSSSNGTILVLAVGL